MIRNTIGKPVEKNDFFDRARETQSLWSHLGIDNVLLLAPRRVGKTSLMLRIRDGAAERGVHAAYLGVADVTTEIAFVEKLYEAAQTFEPARHEVLRIAKGPLGQFFRRIRKVGLWGISIELGDATQEQWQQLGEALSRALDTAEGRWLFLVDELPIFVLSLLRRDASCSRARTFLNWFRQLRLDARSVRWLLAGSIGLDTVTRRMKLGDTINDLYLFTDFGAFTAETADQLLDALGETYSLPLSPEVKARVLARTGWLIPYHLQLFFGELRERCSGRDVNGLKPSVADVDEVYEALLAPAKRAYFDYWEQRLHDELGSPEDRQSIDLLDAVAKNPEGEPVHILQNVLGKHVADLTERDEKLGYLLQVLRSDGYLITEGDRYRFRSSLLRDFWLRRVSP